MHFQTVAEKTKKKLLGIMFNFNENNYLKIFWEYFQTQNVTNMGILNTLYQIRI